MHNNSETIAVSVIIPTFNSEKTIIKCLDSIFTSKISMEVIIIDDCSTDNTNEIISSYQNPILTKKNKINRGAGYSRNIGLSMSKGKYICFVDSDDFVSEQYVDMLYAAATENDLEVDMVICDICSYGKKQKNNDFSFKNKKDLLKKGLVASPCGKLIKRELIIKYPFPENIINEDVASIIPAIAYSKEIVYQKNSRYYYYQRDNSVQNSIFDEKKFDIFKSLDITLERVGNDKYIREILIFNQLLMVLIYMIVEITDIRTRHVYMKKFIYLLKQNDYSISNNEYFLNFIEDKGKQNIIFYKMLTILVDKNYCNLSSILTDIYVFTRKIRRKMTIIPQIDEKMILNSAKYQHSLNQGKYKVSVIVPNYNYAEYLYERIYSILNQKEKIFELIILDDCSSDNSQEKINTIKKLIEPYVKIKVLFNKENTGCVFKQWHKGFELSEGDYVWIAEADDFCNNKFLKDIFSFIGNDEGVVLAYTNTQYINKHGNIINRKVKKLIDLNNTNHWSESYITDGKSEILNYGYLNCTIANVSSVLFKNGDYESIFNFATNFKQIGDWAFYLQIMELGKVAYIDKVDNYYRIHGSNQTTNTKKLEYISEIEKLHTYILEKYDLDMIKRKNIVDRQRELKRQWGIVCD